MASCQKVTKGFHCAVFKCFRGKKEAEVWLKEYKDTAEKEKGLEDLGSEKNYVDIKDRENVKHCTGDCKYDGRDEEYGDMIECCLCKKWYHQDCVGIKTKTQNGYINVEYRDKDDENVATDGSQSQKAGVVEAMGVDASETYTDIDGIEGVSEVEDDILYWFCLTCTSIPKQITELMKRFSEFKKDMRIMKKTLEDIKAKEKTSEPQPEKPTPPEIKTQDSSRSKPRETNSEKETNRVFLEENILLKKEKREIKERLMIMERVIDQILRDQEDKRMYTRQSGYEWVTQTNRNQRIPSQSVRHNVTSRNEDFISRATRRTPASNTDLFARSSIQDFTSKNMFEV